MKFTARFTLALGLGVSTTVSLHAQKPTDPTRPLIAPARPYVLCGMSIFPGDPAVDPDMAKAPPAGTFTLQGRPPSTCRDMSRLQPLRQMNDLPNRLPMFLGPKR